MKILLITSPHLDHAAIHRIRAGTIHVGRPLVAQCFAPMGLVSLAGAIRAARPVIADINKAINQGILPLTEGFYDAAAEWIMAYEPDVVGFMTEADSYHHVLRVLRSVKAANPSVRSLLGGPHASAVHEETLRDFPWVDYVIRGEGEIALEQFVSALLSGTRLSSVGNLTHREQGKVVVNYQLPLIDDLDELPFPDFSGIEFEPNDQLFVEIGRGCPFKCNFCFTAPYWQRRHRIKSPARITQELAYFQNEFGRNDVNFTHDLFTTDRKWVLAFCRHMVDSGLAVTWTCSSRTDTLDEEQLYWMKRAGCRNIYFGIEAGTPEMQKKIHKNLDLEQARYIVGKTVETGVGVTVGFIAGLPGESAVSLRGTLGEAFHYLRLPNATVHMFGFSPYPGSPHFPDIRRYLVHDPCFVDLPLPASVLTQNRAFMRQHFDVFTRYSWMESYEGLNWDTLRAAEEFFPMVNALRDLLLALSDRGIDPFDLLTRWAKWISQENEKCSRTANGLCQGTIAQFLAFLGSYREERNGQDVVLAEMIRWEGLKNHLRSYSATLSLPSLFLVSNGDIKVSGQLTPSAEHGPRVPDARADEILTTNASLATGTFQHACAFVPGGGSLRPGPFAFYVRSDGNPCIVRLPPLGQLAITLARHGMRKSELVTLLCEASGVPTPESRAAAESLVATLERMDLLGSPETNSPKKGAAFPPFALADSIR